MEVVVVEVVVVDVEVVVVVIVVLLSFRVMFESLLKLARASSKERN